MEQGIVAYRAQVSPISTMPDELLTTMFELVVHKNQRSLICVLPCVCKRWKALVKEIRNVEVSFRNRILNFQGCFGLRPALAAICEPSRCLAR